MNKKKLTYLKNKNKKSYKDKKVLQKRQLLRITMKNNKKTFFLCIEDPYFFNLKGEFSK